MKRPQIEALLEEAARPDCTQTRLGGIQYELNCAVDSQERAAMEKKGIKAVLNRLSGKRLKKNSPHTYEFL